MSATIHPFRRAADRPPITLTQFMASLALIEATMAWLVSNNLCVIGFGCTRHGPLITIAAQPAAYKLAKGSAERRGYRQIGALRHETWSFSAQGGVEVCWEEVVCVH